MSERDDGGPAFPGYWENDTEGNATAPDGAIVPPMTQHGISGMSLRDYFAAGILQALVGRVNSRESEENVLKLPEIAYKYADLMIKARNK